MSGAGLAGVGGCSLNQKIVIIRGIKVRRNSKASKTVNWA